MDATFETLLCSLKDTAEGLNRSGRHLPLNVRRGRALAGRRRAYNDMLPDVIPQGSHVF